MLLRSWCERICEVKSGCCAVGLRMNENLEAHQAPFAVRLNSKYSPVLGLARNSSAKSYFHSSGVNAPGEAEG